MRNEKDIIQKIIDHLDSSMENLNECNKNLNKEIVSKIDEKLLKKICNDIKYAKAVLFSSFDKPKD